MHCNTNHTTIVSVAPAILRTAALLTECGKKLLTGGVGR